MTNDLLKFICEYHNIEGGKQFFYSLDKFFQEKYKSSPLLFYSRPKDATRILNKRAASSCRLLWNRNKFEKEYLKSDIDTILENICKKEPIFEKWRSYNINGKNYIAIFCGENKHQIYFSVFCIGDKIENNLFDYLLLFLIGNSKRQNKINELQKLESLVYIDDVTGLYNQRKLLIDLEHSIKRYKELKENFTILFLDIDHFKSVNDNHGHLVGTLLLHDMGKLLGRVLRETDLIYRYGGDEFVIIVRDIGPDTAEKIGERILSVVKNTDFSTKVEKNNKELEEKFKLSVSIGIASFPEDAQSQSDVLRIADKMMYEAKEGGRGQVCHAKSFFKKKVQLRKV